MMRKSSAPDEDAQARLEAFIGKYDPAMAALGRKLFAHLSKRLPGAIELAYDNYNALAVGYGPTEKPKDIPISIALYPRWATLFLMKGGALDDPEGRLDGKGPLIRSLRLVDGLKTLKDPYVDALISAAVMQAGWTLTPKAKNRLIIKSISPKQRPRTP